LDVEKKNVGTITSSKKKPSGIIDVAMLQTLAKRDNLEEILAPYSQVIVDECHHVAAFTFESVLKRCSARYVVGLTATPYRRDGHHKIITMQCGPVRHEMLNQTSVKLEKNVIVRETKFKMPEDCGPQPPIHQVWNYLVKDQYRLDMICKDVISELLEKRIPLIISERKDQLYSIAEKLRLEIDKATSEIFILEGSLGKKERTKILDAINIMVDKQNCPCLLTTGSFIGEGFDLPALDTLFLAMPISFRGKVVQYAGRIHRSFEGKNEVRIYDYVDSWLPLTISMYR